MKNLSQSQGVASILSLVGCLTLVTSVQAQEIVENHFPVITPESAVVRDGDKGARIHSNLRMLSITPDVSPHQLSAFNTPSTIRSAYGLPSYGGSSAIAIVDPFDYPTALSDFNQFSRRFSLPQEGSSQPTSQNSVFEVVYASGKVPPSSGYLAKSWNMEASLDVEWAHAIAPNAKIYLVEAASDSPYDLFAAVQKASTLPGVKEVSMSWGSTDARSDLNFNYIFQTPGIVFLAASGDQSALPQYPATSPDVIAVGGTTLNRNASGNFVSETAWSDTGGGVSWFQARPEYQDGLASIVGNQRGTPDISFNANPNTGYIIANSGEPGQTWYVVGGTSAATPCIAGLINVSSTSVSGFARNTQIELNRLYSNLGNPYVFRDITSGMDGPFSCKVGWDFVTGVGSPVGLAGK